MGLGAAWDDLWRLSKTGKSADKVTAAMRLVTIGFEGQERRGGDVVMPMAVHSMRVGLQLNRYGADLETILAGFCHDMIEDTAVTAAQLEVLFGEDVRRLVEACTLDEQLYEANHRAGNQDLVERAATEGPRAVFIKVVDILDNLATYYQVPEAWQQEMRECATVWLELGQRLLGVDHAAVKDLDRTLSEITTR